jgi:multidrug efflux system membrane fusion protein
MKAILFPILILAIHAAGILHAADAGGSAPATITKEGDLVILTLKPEAEVALRLKVVSVEQRTVPAVRLFSGEVVTPLAADGKPVAPVLGGTLDEVLRLADLQATADGRILQAQVQMDAAKIAVERAQKMLDAEAGSVRGVDEAKTSLALAEAAMATAKAQRDLLGSPVGQSGAQARLGARRGLQRRIRSARSRSTRIRQGLGWIEPFKKRQARGRPTHGERTDQHHRLVLRTCPPIRNSAAANGSRSKSPRSTARSKASCIPFNAVLHDIHGGQWVYELTAPHTYTRKRIQVARLSGARRCCRAVRPSARRSSPTDPPNCSARSS